MYLTKSDCLFLSPRCRTPSGRTHYYHWQSENQAESVQTQRCREKSRQHWTKGEILPQIPSWLHWVNTFEQYGLS